ncbi:hypothetical protein CyaNS01_02863 [Cyanobium sp. NS01]|nr:hypothetical protein CyaNS01_02863 [Cyanobium sp. NS01]
MHRCSYTHSSDPLIGVHEIGGSPEFRVIDHDHLSLYMDIRSAETFL